MGRHERVAAPEEVYREVVYREVVYRECPVPFPVVETESEVPKCQVEVEFPVLVA
tara:strand:- start:1168 stop:1332 length:165 start_codon:yes stop_codon:yes gene_type:complete